tara:strand:+ start:152 stop:475 length:324 start_codon:yes stop_codon:yes gene_type:complete
MAKAPAVSVDNPSDWDSFAAKYANHTCVELRNIASKDPTNSTNHINMYDVLCRQKAVAESQAAATDLSNRLSVAAINATVEAAGMEFVIDKNGVQTGKTVLKVTIDG